jgi:hypothetical protein
MSERKYRHRGYMDNRAAGTQAAVEAAGSRRAAVAADDGFW